MQIRRGGRKFLETESPRLNRFVTELASPGIFRKPWQPPGRSFLASPDVVAARVIGGEHRDLFAGQLAGNAAHLFTYVILSNCALEGLHLLFEIGPLLTPQLGGPRCHPNRSVA